MPVDLSPEVASDCLWLVADELKKIGGELGEHTVPDAGGLTVDQRDFVNNVGSRLRMLTSILGNAIEYV